MNIKIDLNSFATNIPYNYGKTTQPKNRPGISRFQTSD